MEVKAPSVEGVLIAMGVFPTSRYFDCTLKFFENFVEMKNNCKTKLKIKDVYAKTSQDIEMNKETLRIFLRRALRGAYRRTKFKFLFNYFDIEVDAGFKPRPTEVGGLIYLIERDRKKQQETV